MINYIVKSEQTKEAHQVKDVTDNPLKSHELFRDKDFNYLFAGDFVLPAIKEEMRQKAIADDIIKGGMSDFHPPSNTANTKAPNTYQ